MKINSLVTTIVTLLVLAGCIVGVVLTFGSKSDVQNKVTELTPTNEKDPINVGILDSDAIKNAQKPPYKAYGAHPIVVNPNNINRPNPFDGI